MAEEANAKNKKTLIGIIVGAILVIAAVVVAIVLIVNRGETLNDEFFKTDDKKIVITNTSEDGDSSVAKKVHQVYTIDGDKVTGLKVYSEFESEQAAKDADAKPEVAEAMKTGSYKDHKVQGKYIIITMADSAYEGVTVEQLRTTAELIQDALKNGNNQEAIVEDTVDTIVDDSIDGSDGATDGTTSDGTTTDGTATEGTEE